MPTSKTKIAMGITLGCLASGCGSSKKKSSAESSPAMPDLFAVTDLTADSSLTAELAADLPSDLAKQGEIYDNQPTSATTPAVATGSCTSIENAPTVTATTNTLTISYTLDLTACTNQDDASTSNGLTYKSYTESALVELTCVGGDLSSYNGQTLGKFYAVTTAPSCPTGTLKSESVTNIVSTSSGGTTSYKFLDYTGHTDLSPCQVTVANDVASRDNSCTEIDKSTSSTTVAGTATTGNSFYSFVEQNMSSSNDSTTEVWPLSGTLAVTYNSWTGTLTYVNGTTPPTYKMTDPAQGTITGSLTATANLALRARSRLGSRARRVFRW